MPSAEMGAQACSLKTNPNHSARVAWCLPEVRESPFRDCCRITGKPETIDQQVQKVGTSSGKSRCVQLFPIFKQWNYTFAWSQGSRKLLVGNRFWLRRSGPSFLWVNWSRIETQALTAWPAGRRRAEQAAEKLRRHLARWSCCTGSFLLALRRAQTGVSVLPGGIGFKHCPDEFGSCHTDFRDLHHGAEGWIVLTAIYRWIAFSLLNSQLID